MRQLLFILISTILLSKTSFSQVYLEPLVGYQFDINKTNSKLFNTGIQLALKKKKVEFFVQIQKGWSQKDGTGIDSSFTLNTNLPLSAPAQKTFKPSIFSAGIGARVRLLGKQSRNSLYATWGLGVMYQKSIVNYSFDKINYIVLNPDQTQSQTGVYGSAGLEYMLQLKTGRFFLDVNIASPPSSSGNHPYPAYKFVTPLSFNIGYSIKLSKR